MLSEKAVRELQRACSEENRRCVGAKQNFDDFAKGLSVRMRNHSVNARLEYQPELGVMGTGYSVEVSFNNVHLGAPMSVDARGEVDAALTPFRARMENLTYASAVYADIQVHTEEPVAMRRDKARDNGCPGSCRGGVAYKGDSATRVYLGTVPVMVGSALCTTRTSGVGLQEELDPGGYFIIQGKERIVPWFRNTDQYSCVAYLGKDGELFCTVRSGTRYGKTLSTRLVKPTDGPAQIKFKNSFLLGEGALTPGTVLARLGADHAHVFERLTPADRAFYGAESFAADDPPADQAEDGWSEDDASGDVFGGLFPTTVPSLRSAALVSFLRVARYMRESNNLTDRDSLQSTQLLGIREILNEVFDKTMRQTCKSLRQKLETRLRKVHQKRFDNKNHRAATTQMPNASWVREELRRSPPMVSMHYFFATGNMQGGGGNAGNGARNGYARATRTGCCQILERCTELQMSAAHNKVVSSLNNAPSAARELRMDSLGYLCPVSTPEGKRTGLINQRATGASVSRDRSGSIPAVVDMARHFMCDPGADCGARLAGVWISGQFVGCTARPAELAASLRAARRGGQLPRDMGVTRLFDVAVEIRLHSGRMLKPLLPLGEGVTPVESFLASVEHTTWSRLIHAGVLETLDTREEGGAMVCPYDQPSGPRHTHRELFPAAYLGCVAATTPNLDGEPMVRGAYYCNQAAQGLGYDPRNFSKTRLPVKSYGLYYPQKSLVSTSYHRHSGADQRAPVVSNVCIAVMSLQGCEEDAILVNRAAVERGLFRGFMKDTKTVTTADRVPKCFAYDPSGASSLDPDTGLARVGTVLKKGDPYAGIASAAGVRTLKHNQPLDATVERVMLYNNAEGGFRTAKIVARTNLPLQVGDKLTSRYAQKGVVSRLLAAEEMPWVEGGLEAGGIDIIVNPCFLPSRMTVAQIAEHTFGFAAAVLGLNHVDGTAFSGMMSKVWRQLKAKGFRSNKRWVRDPCTGQRLGRVEIGIASYLRLNKLSSAKMRVRTDGKRDPITGQPVAGKGTGEKALRFGGMEMTSLQAWGAAATLDDACRGRSDATTARVCEDCGNIHMLDKDAQCRLCGGKAVEVQTNVATVRMAQTAAAMNMDTRFLTKKRT